jgi:hypothetical protein
MLSTDNRQRYWAAEAAIYLRVSRSTLAKWRMNGSGPPFHRCGPRLVYYFRDEMDNWLECCDAQSKAPRAPR